VSSLTVLLPTLGRPTLPRMLQSLAEQEWAADDELLLVSDDRHDWCHEVFLTSGLRGRHLAAMGGPLSNWGHTLRNWFMPCARGEYLWHVDDDDVVMPGALARIHKQIETHPGHLHMFRFYGGGNLYWDSPGVGNWTCGTPCLVHPRDIRLGTWQPWYGGDQAFVHETTRNNPDIPIHWHDEVVYCCVGAGGAKLRLDECYEAVAPRLRERSPSWRLVPGKQEWTDLAYLGGAGGRGDCQAGWHRLAASLFRGLEVLDVGAGLGMSRKRFRGQAKRLVSQDPAPGLPVDLHEPVERLPGKSFDVVVSFDVIEHVEDDHHFAGELLRIARRAAFLTTPNWLVSRAGNPAHVREYTPSQLAGLLGPLGAAQFWVGDSGGLLPREVSREEFVRSREPHLAVLLRLDHNDSSRA